MPNIFAHASDGKIYKSNSDWATARDATTGGSASYSGTLSAYAIRSARTASRGGGTSYFVTRTFMYFDTAAYARYIFNQNVDFAWVRKC